MKSGPLRDRGRIQEDTSNDDTPTPTWTVRVGNWPCTVLPVGGDETYRGRQLEAHVDYVITGRRIKGITPKMRWYGTAGLCKGKYLNIEQVHEKWDQQKNPILELYCTELTTV